MSRLETVLSDRVGMTNHLPVVERNVRSDDPNDFIAGVR